MNIDPRTILFILLSHGEAVGDVQYKDARGARVLSVILNDTPYSDRVERYSRIVMVYWWLLSISKWIIL